MNSADYKQKYNNASTGLFKDNSSGDIGANDARALVVDTGDNFLNLDSQFGSYARQATCYGTNTYTATVTISPTTVISNGALYIFFFENTSTAAASVVLNGNTRKLYVDLTTQAGADDLLAGIPYWFVYNGALDSGAGGLVMTNGGGTGGGGGGGTPTLTDVLTANNDAGTFAIQNLGAPTDTDDAATKGYVDTVVSGLTQNLSSVLSEGNDAGGVTITNLPTPSVDSDAATKEYVDDTASGSIQLDDFSTLVDAAPVECDCDSLKEPKFYLETGTSRTLNITELRADSVLNNYVTILYIIKKTVAGDITITLDSSYTNKDIATDGSATSYLLSGASNSYFKLTAVVRGESSGCIMWWNLVTVAGGGGSSLWGGITGTLSDQTDLNTALGLKSPIASPTFTGTVTTPLIKITGGSPGVGKVLTSDADGDATWEASSVSAATDTAAGIVELATPAEVITGTDSTRAVTAEGVHGKVVGVQDLYVQAASMVPRVTSGCSPLAQTEIAGSLMNILTLDFNQTTQQYAQFMIVPPRNWNNGTITFVPYWTAASGSGGVVWSLQGGAYSNDDALSTAFGTVQTSTDTFITVNDQHTGPESSAITLAGSPADADLICVQISRVTGDGSDTLTADAKLIGISIRFTMDAAKAA